MRVEPSRPAIGNRSNSDAAKATNEQPQMSKLVRSECNRGPSHRSPQACSAKGATGQAMADGQCIGPLWAPALTPRSCANRIANIAWGQGAAPHIAQPSCEGARPLQANGACTTPSHPAPGAKAPRVLRAIRNNRKPPVLRRTRTNSRVLRAVAAKTGIGG